MWSRQGKWLLVCGLCLWASCGLAHAWQTTVDGCCANPSSSNAYWSGTVAQVMGHWKALSGIAKVELYVNERLFYQQEWTSGYPTIWPPQPGPDKTWCVRAFSTTQWPDNTELVLKAVCVPRIGPTQTVTKPGQYARNRSWSLYNIDIHESAAQAAGAADVACASSNHTADGPACGYLKGAILDKLSDYQVFYIATHSGGGWFGDCLYPGSVPADHAINASLVNYWLGDRTASDPGFNLVFIDGCNSAIVPTLYNGFSRDGSAVVQCYLGWNTGIPDDDTSSDWTIAFWSGLQSQMTVLAAIEYACSQVPGREGWWVTYGSNCCSYKLHAVYGCG